MRELTDEQLMVCITRNDQEAFACLLGRHLDSIHRYLSRITGSQADADDLAQETFIRVWQKAHTFKPGRVKFTTWLHRIAHNLSIDEFRKRRVSDETEVAELADERSDQFQHHANRETLALLTQAIGTLPEAQRCALMLCQVQGFSNQDAAVVLDVSLHALESLLARARRTLKATLYEGDAFLGEANERSR
ncbi:MAG: sigma-70 family RNA polymerase sigma factor [Gammaproteobacteria bacterium]|nr:sigma-70 family RNA polymerase sigma factor [Gammaproteobacteria bacterium]